MAKKPVKKTISQMQEANKPTIKSKIEIPIVQSAPKAGYSQFNIYCIVLSVVSFAIYVNSIWNSFVLDDVMVLKENKYVIQGIKAIPEIFSTPHMRGYLVIPNDLYRPLSLAMFAVEYQFFGLNSYVHHFLNIITYIACIIAFFVFMNKFLDHKKLAVAFLAALFFALHPIHTEVVSNIKSRDELLCFLFAIMALISFINYVKKDAITGAGGKITHLLFGIFLLFLSYLSKETVVTFLGVIPVLFFLYKNEDKKKSIFIFAGAVVVTVIYLVIRGAVLKAYDANQPTPVEFIDNALSGAPSAVVKFATEILLIGYYLKMMILPYPLISNYSYNAIPFADFAHVGVWLSLIAYLFLIGYSIIALIKNNKNPWVFGILFYLFTISLFSNFPFLMGAEIAERFTFFASAGFCIVLALAFDKWLLKGAELTLNSLKNVKIGVPLLVICILYAGITFPRNYDWKTNSTLYRADLAKSPEDARLNYYLGTAMAEGQYEGEKDTVEKHKIDAESVEHLKKALELYPMYSEANAEIGRVYYRERMYDLAIKHDKKALEANPNHVTANNNLGSVYLTTAKYDSALFCFRKAISLNPEYVYAYFNSARCFMQLKQYDSAIYYFNKSLAFNPSNADAEQELGMAWYFKQQWDSATVHFKKTYAINPNDANIVNSLGAIYLNTKKYPEAIQWFQKAIQLNSGYVNAYSNLGRAYYFSEQFPQALETFLKETQIAPKYYNDIPYIALCYQKIGKRDSALKWEAIAKRIYSDFKL